MREHTDLLVDITPEHYEDFAVKATAPWNAHLKMRICAEVENIMSPARRLLDAGMGTGHMLFELQDVETLNDYQFCGVDIDPGMVNFCQQKVNAAGMQHKISLCRASISQLPYADGTFSLVYARSVIHHWAEPVKALQELCRVLDTGGVMVIHEPLSNPGAEALALFNERRAQYGVKPMTTGEKLTVEQLNALLEQCCSDNMHYIIKPGEGIAALGCEIRIARNNI